MLTIEQRRKTDRKRRERWRKRKLAQGCKQIQVMLSPEAQEILAYEKSRTGEPYVQIVHRAIIELDKVLPITPSKNQVQSMIPETTKTNVSDTGKTKARSKVSGEKKESQQDQLKLF
jgi:hypothetical protein